MRPKKSYSDPTGALLSPNRVRLATDGKQYLAVGRPHHGFLTVADLASRSARKCPFTGSGIERQMQKDLEPGGPDFAAVELYGAVAFGPSRKLYVQSEFGVLELGLDGGSERALLVPEPVAREQEVPFPGALSMAVDSSHVFLAPAGKGRLDVYQRQEPGERGEGLEVAKRLINVSLALFIALTALDLGSVCFLAAGLHAEGNGEVTCALFLGELGYPLCRRGGCGAVGADYCCTRCVDCGCVPGYRADCPVRWDPNS